MGCKCGARVKASRVSRQNGRFCWNFGLAPLRLRNAAAGDGTGGSQTKVAAASGLSGAEMNTGRDKARRGLPRSNNIRLSKALERIMGKRAKTFSRTVRKSDAIKATFTNAFGNGRGSAMVSFRKTRR